MVYSYTVIFYKTYTLLLYTIGAIYDMSDQSEDAQKAYKKAKEHGLQDLFTSLTPLLLLPPHSSTTTANIPYTNNIHYSNNNTATNTTTTTANNSNTISSNSMRGVKRAAPV